MVTIDLDARAAALAVAREEASAIGELSDATGPAAELRARQRDMHLRLHLRRSDDAVQAYLATVPILPVSRCPLTGATVRRSVDPVDIDGLWWDALAPIRPREPHLQTLFGFTGALRLSGPPPWTPFLVAPGPEVPCVQPRLLERPGIHAVLSSLTIGQHLGYVICYFADPFPEVRRVDDWGARRYAATADPPAPQGWGTAESDTDVLDPDLGSWIRGGRLRWIAPGDRDLRLRGETTGCPYLDLPGSPEPARIRYGRIRRGLAPNAVAEATDAGS